MWEKSTFAADVLPQLNRCLSQASSSASTTEQTFGANTFIVQCVDKKTIKLAAEDKWQKLAESLGVSYCKINSLKQIDVLELRPLKIIPHVVPYALVVETDNALLFLKATGLNGFIPLQQLLRYHYSNVDVNSQLFNYVWSNLAELFAQLASRQLFPRFIPSAFFADRSLWMLCDVFHCELSIEAPQVNVDTNAWLNGKLSSYDYLLSLNSKAGRSKDDINNYPIFPWVCDFTEANGGWRAMNKTMFRLNKGDDQLRAMYAPKGTDHVAHHVPELLSEVSVLVYRARKESKEMLCRHVRSKWVPLEYPVSISRMYQWTPEECIPDFYDDPSVFVSNHNDMADLELPPFAATPETFIEWHRSALELCEDLHLWIDLVFGYLLKGDDAVRNLNVHLCFVEKSNVLRTHGMVQLFERPHPKRMTKNNENDEFKINDLAMRAYECTFGSQRQIEKSEDEDDEENLFARYKKLLQSDKSQEVLKTCVDSLCGILEAFWQAKSSHLLDRMQCDDASNVPSHFEESFEVLKTSHLSADEVPLLMLTSARTPVEVIRFHDEMSDFYSNNLLRSSHCAPSVEQTLLLREINALRSCIQLPHSHLMQHAVVCNLEKLLSDECASVVAVYRLISTVCRLMSRESLDELLTVITRLLQNDKSVKLLDRRFVLPVSIVFGRMFFERFLPILIESVASTQNDRSLVAKETVVWLSKRFGPVICARFISSNLLRILPSCYAALNFTTSNQNPTSIFKQKLEGDGSCVEDCLIQIAAGYGVTFITAQYLPFSVDVVEQASRRLTVQLEHCIVAALRVVRFSVNMMADSHLMSSIEDIVDTTVLGALRIALATAVPFSSDRVRLIVLTQAVSCLHFLSERIGVENTRRYAKKPFELLFDSFEKLYETNAELRISKKTVDENMVDIPLWFVCEMIERFALDWGIPVLSSFCENPAFLVPFVSEVHLSSSPSQNIPLGATYQLNSFSGGNRLFAIGSPSSSSPSPLPSVGVVDSGSLNMVWAARVSAAVRSNNNRPRFDHLTLCSFNGHSGAVRKIDAIANENSFVTASSDKTVRIWSVKPEYEEVEAQYIYRGHSKSVLDVKLIANNSIASTDGVVHIWDPFRGVLLAQLGWDDDNVTALSPVSLHTLAAVSSLGSTVRLLDSRVGDWICDLKVSPTNGVTRTLAVDESGTSMLLAMSSGVVALCDVRTGKVSSLSHGNSTHVNSLHWLSSKEFLVCDSDEPGIVYSTATGRLVASRRLKDVVLDASVADDLLATLQANNTLRVYSGAEQKLEYKLRSDVVQGSALHYLPFNSLFLLGSSSGSIKLMC